MKTIKFLSMAALALVGAVMTGCSNKDDVTVDPLQPASNVVTLKTTICLSGGETRALTSGGVKTFAADETMALVYKNTSGNTVKVVSAPLEAGDIESGSKWATFTFTLENPNKSENVTYIYPAAMAGETDVDYSNLASQDGTLATLSSDLDLAKYSGAWSGESLPANVTLDNQLAILAITLKDNAATPTEITSSITGMTISDGTNTYTVSRSAAAGPIYVAIRPTTSANIKIYASDGSKYYNKSLTGKTYAASNGYPVSWKMPEALISAATTADYGMAVCAAGHLHLAKTAVPAGCTAVGILGKVTETGHGLILALQDAASQTWNTINGWTSETTYAGTTLQVLPDDAARGSLASYTALGETTVSNWAVAQKSDYEAIFENLGSTAGDSYGTGYDNDMNLFITTGVGGSELSDDYWSATNDPDLPWVFGNYWFHNPGSRSNGVRPVLGFSLKDPAPAGPTAYTLAESTQGMIVGTDGKAYDVADKDNLPTGVTAAGMVAYKSGSNGLVIALSDEASTMDWSTAKSASGAAAHTPAVSGYSWVLPNKDQWTSMIDAAGGYEALRDGFEGVGGTNLQSDESARYWSSTAFDSDEAWRIYFYNGIWNWDYKDESRYVRACLAF